MLLKHKGFSAVAIIALGLGIRRQYRHLQPGQRRSPSSASVSEFGSHRLFRRKIAAGITDSDISYLDFTDWSRQTISSRAPRPTGPGTPTFSGDGAEPEARAPRRRDDRVLSVLASSLFSAERSFPKTTISDIRRRPGLPVAIISHGLWKRRFGSDPAIIRKVVQMKSRPLTVIG